MATDTKTDSDLRPPTLSKAAASHPEEPVRSLLKFQKQYGNRYVQRMTMLEKQCHEPISRKPELASHVSGNGTVVQRRIVLWGDGGKADLEELLQKHGVGDIRDWFLKRVRPKIVGQFGYSKFLGYLKHEHDEYTLDAKITPKGKEPTFDEITAGVINAINFHQFKQMTKGGHSQIGKVPLIKRKDFPNFVKEAFSKSEIMKETGLKSREVHLRHFVMGSWFRALPHLLRRTKLEDKEKKPFESRLANLIPRLTPWSFGKKLESAGDPFQDIELLAQSLHHLPANLNAGEGVENSLIGFLSHACSDLAEKIKSEKTSIEYDTLPDFIQTMVRSLDLIPSEGQEAWLTGFGPIRVFMSMVPVGEDYEGALPPDTFAQVLHDFAYQLGMDFMKRDTGKTTGLQGKEVSIPQLQRHLVPLGENLYAMIVRAQDEELDLIDWEKLFIQIEQLAGWMEGLK